MKQKRNLARFFLALSVLAWALLCIVCLTSEAQAGPSPAPAPYPADAGRLPGDDIPATADCRLPAEEVPTVHVLAVIVTHYCTCERCCGKSDGITAIGTAATPYVTAAVDPAVVPLGTDLVMDYGDGIQHTYRAEDTGSAIQGARVDICVSSHQEALDLGVRSAVLRWAEEGALHDQ